MKTLLYFAYKICIFWLIESYVYEELYIIKTQIIHVDT